MKLLKFSSQTCNPCKVLAKTLADADLGIMVEEIDFDEHEDMFNEFNIRAVPTLVHLPSKKKLQGLKTEAEIKEWLAFCRL